MVSFIDHIQVGAARALGFRSRRIPTPQGEVHLLDARGSGDLPPVLLLHGLSSSAADYVPLMRRLRSRVSRVIAVDLPGHGLSQVPRDGMRAPAVQEAMLGALVGGLDGPVVVYGNSLGGMAAVRLAARAPERVRGLLLASPGGAPLGPAQLAAFLENFELHSHRLALEFVDRTLPEMGLQAPFAALGVRARFARRPVRELLEQLSPDDLLTPAELASISVPVLLSWGRLEQLLPASHLQWFLAHLPPHARFETPETHGHAPYVTAPDDVADRILDFTARL